jgi:16S rRNA G966 N2-methylase RsmD
MLFPNQALHAFMVTVRIVAGRLKGRTLKGPSSTGIRPTSDGLRETLFIVLGD